MHTPAGFVTGSAEPLARPIATPPERGRETAAYTQPRPRPPPACVCVRHPKPQTLNPKSKLRSNRPIFESLYLGMVKKAIDEVD